MYTTAYAKSIYKKKMLALNGTYETYAIANRICSNLIHHRGYAEGRRR